MRADQREQARRLYQPDLDTMKSRLPDLGAALDAAFCELSKDVSMDRIDQALMKLKGAEQSLVVMRRAKVEQGSSQ
jgi:hypothetical protein